MSNMNEELNDIIEDLKNKGKMNFQRSASEVLIRAFEIRNKVILPEKLKEWLRFSDGGEFFLPAGVQIFGVAHKPTIDIDENDRPNDNYLVIGTLASGDPILCEKSGEVISVYNHEANRIEEDEKYEDFFEFLKGLNSLLGIGA